MRYARILSIGLVATVAFVWSAAAVENAHELAGYCQSLERGANGDGRHLYIPRTREALTCWGYMQAMQDLSVLADEEGHRIMGACPPEQTMTLQLIHSFVRYARAHGGELQGNAVVAVFRALREAYPCRAKARGLNLREHYSFEPVRCTSGVNSPTQPNPAQASAACRTLRIGELMVAWPCADAITT